ncbi:phage tail spike protein [Streptococcus sp. ZY1909104]|uniref:phage tail spike protein n=1 Tax=Streptococcus sp. ZY1909104 TaxID=3233335 RepID=UPI00349F0D1B
MLYLLDKDVRTVKWNGIPLHEASSAIVKEETNGDFYITVCYPITDSSIYQLIKEDMLIKAPTPVLGPQLFRIKKPVENDDSLDITAYHISDDVMQRSITPVSVVGQGCAMALSQMVQNAKTDLGTFSFTSDIMDSRTFNTTETETLYTVLMDGKHSIVGTWEGELVRDNFALTVKRSRGADRGVVVTTHKNLKSYQRTKNSQSVVTRIHARSTFRAEGAETDTVLAVTVDSPLIGNYPYINEKEYENNNAKTVDELRKWAEAKFKHEGIDKISDAIEIEAYELDGQVIHLGDTVNIKSRKHDVDIYKKAIAYEYNALMEEYISITFDDKPGVGGSGVSSGVSNAADVILGVNANTQEIAVERAIRNANQAFDAEFDKRVKSIHDGIEQAKAEAELYADNIKQSIDADINAVTQSMEANQEEQSQKVAAVLAKAGVAENLATDAKRISDEVKSGLSDKVSLQDFMDAYGGLSNAFTQQYNQLNGQLSTKLSRVEVDGYLDAKGYITNSALQNSLRSYPTITEMQNKVTKTATSFERTISRVESQIPTEAGGRNYILGSRTVRINTNNPQTCPISTEQLKDGSREFIRIRRSNASLNPSLISLYTEIRGFSSEIPTSGKGKISFKARASTPVNMNVMGILISSTSTNLPWDRSQIFIGTEWKTYSFDFEFVKGMTILRANPLQILPPVPNLAEFYLDLCEWQLEAGSMTSSWSPAPEDLTTTVAFNNVKSTVDGHTRTIGAVGTAGSILDNVSKVTQTAAGLVQEVSGDNGLKTQVSTLAGSYAIKSLTKAGDVLGQINLNKDGSVKIDGKLVQITGTTYIQDGVISSAKIGSLDAGKITTGTLDAARIKANSIDGSKMVFDQAFVNKMTANEAYLQQIFAKNAFITQVQAVTLSASKISGGILSATNGAMRMDLNNANISFNKNAAINFNSANNALVRRRGTHTAFLHFNDVASSADANAGGVYAGLGVTSSGDGINSQSSGRFSGIRIFRSAIGYNHNPTLDRVEIYGDTIYFKDAFDESRGYVFKTVKTVNQTIDMNLYINAIKAIAHCLNHLRANNWDWKMPNLQSAVSGLMDSYINKTNFFNKLQV